MSTTTAYHGTFLLSIFLIVCFLELVALTLELYWLVSFLRAIARERSPITQTCHTYDAWIIRGSWLSKICRQCSLLLLFWQKNKQALRKSMTFVMCTFQAETSRIVYAYSIYSRSVSTYDAWIIRGSWLSKICRQCSLLLLFWQKNKQALRKSMTFVMCTFQAETSRIVYAYSIYSRSVSTGWVCTYSVFK